MKSIFFIFSILLLKLRVTISFGFFENHIHVPKVLNGPILILIFNKESGTALCLELLLPMGKELVYE